ncbi:MAG TPA: PQQ-dependent sugar dehydrogenase [Thermoanaerobaculia bacterium]|nr:PQQ-dependent sugar dehydrogenase [Thermoanaerobaculia bacterium]
MLKRLTAVILLTILSSASIASAEILPGFRLEQVAAVSGFLTSLAFDPAGRLYFSTTRGDVFRIGESGPVKIAMVPSAAEGNAAFLGIAFESEESFVTHYVSADLRTEVISRVDVATGVETNIARIPCDEGRVCSSEHHGGNPIVAPDGSIFVAFGDFGGGVGAQNPKSPAGKILQIHPGGSVEMYALGFRNPFDLAYDPLSETLIAGDNGPVGEDEILIVARGENHGWPFTMGNQPPVDGTVPPLYVFEETTAPTGLVRLRAAGYFPEGGVLVGGFVSRALYFFPTLDDRPVSDPVIMLQHEIGVVIDVAQSPDGDLYVASPFAVYRLVPPLRGDANGDGVINDEDLKVISQKLLLSGSSVVFRAQEGLLRASWGADVNGDGVIDARDLVALGRMLNPRPRAVRR